MARNSDFWKDVLNSPRHVVAPMVDQSELPWRLMARKNGADLVYTPMLHANIFNRDATYRHDNFTTSAEEQPLIVQFCANDAATLLDAAKKATEITSHVSAPPLTLLAKLKQDLQDNCSDESGPFTKRPKHELTNRQLRSYLKGYGYNTWKFDFERMKAVAEGVNASEPFEARSDLHDDDALKTNERRVKAVDLNLGCPQTIAKRGHYGAFLQDEWDLIRDLISTCANHLPVPITAKMRVLDTSEKTVQYAQMLQNAGAAVVTVHGRTREQRGALTGLASWSRIRAVKEALRVPVIANGNIQCYADVERCMEETGADAVMSAEGQLGNPYIFRNDGAVHTVWDAAREYLHYVDAYPTKHSYARGHLFRMLHYPCLIHPDTRASLGRAKSIEDLKAVVDEIERLVQPHVDIYNNSTNTEVIDSDPRLNAILSMPVPYWICQARTRDPTLESCLQRREIVVEYKAEMKEKYQAMAEQTGLSINKVKRLMRCPDKKFDYATGRATTCKSQHCGNPMNKRCSFSQCAKCCLMTCKLPENVCLGHKQSVAS